MLKENVITQLKKSLQFFNNLNYEEQEKLISASKVVNYNKSDIVHSGLNQCNGVIIVASGTLRAYLLNEDGKEVTLYKLTQNDVCVLSASCIINNISFEVFIAAETDVHLILIDTKVYDKLKEKNIEIEKFTSGILNQRFSDTIWAIEKILFLSFDKRLALFLLEQSELENSNELNITHMQIANNIASAREVVTRMLNYFEQENIVKLYKGKVEIVNAKKLRDIATQ